MVQGLLCLGWGFDSLTQHLIVKLLHVTALRSKTTHALATSADAYLNTEVREKGKGRGRGDLGRGLRGRG